MFVKRKDIEIESLYKENLESKISEYEREIEKLKNELKYRDNILKELKSKLDLTKIAYFFSRYKIKENLESKILTVSVSAFRDLIKYKNLEDFLKFFDPVLEEIEKEKRHRRAVEIAKEYLEKRGYKFQLVEENILREIHYKDKLILVYGKPDIIAYKRTENGFKKLVVEVKTSENLPEIKKLQLQFYSWLTQTPKGILLIVSENGIKEVEVKYDAKTFYNAFSHGMELIEKMIKVLYQNKMNAGGGI